MNTEQLPKALRRLAEKLRGIIRLLGCGFADDIGTNDLSLAAMEIESPPARVQELKGQLEAVRAGGDSTDDVTVLPDGSAFAVYSYPLPKGHWLYAPREYEQGAEEPKELAAPILTHAAREQVISAIRYAVRGATDCGKETDFDPDALVQNAVYALCGPFNKNQPQPQADARDAERWSEIGKSIERACGELPEDFEINIHLENGAGTASLLYPSGEECENFPHDDGFAGVVNAAIDAAIAAAKEMK